MDARRHVALALADTFLAGNADQASLVAGARRALGRDWRWIAHVCRALRKRTGEHFHSFSRDELAEFILGRDIFSDAWQGPRPHPEVRQYCVDPPRPVALPDWVEQLALPCLPTHGDLARWLGASAGELDWFADHWRNNDPLDERLRHYHYRWVAKKSGGVRLIEVPKERLRHFQRQILRQLLSRIPLHDAAHGFCQGRSALTHATLHGGQEVVIRMDLQDFFASIPSARIQALFSRVGYPIAVASVLARLCTNRVPRSVLRGTDTCILNLLGNRHLPQGAPSSPPLANLCAFRLDIRLAALADCMDARYSRYADDLTFSGGADLAQAFRRFHIQVTAIAREEGFVVNMRKTRFMSAGARQMVAGIVVNQGTNVARRDFDRLKAILTNCIRHGAASQNRAGHADFRAHLAGRIAHMRSINPKHGEKLHALFGRIDWHAA